MTMFDQITRIDDIEEMRDLLCAMTECVCEHCKFADGQKVRAEDECALITYLKSEVEG